MRLVYLDTGLTLLLCFIVWFILLTGAARLCLLIPGRFLKTDRWLFRTRRFEDGGHFYERVFKIKTWKHLLPDGAAISRSGYAKRHINDFSIPNLERFLVESCRGELTHWIPLLLFWVFGFFVPPGVILLMLLYALVTNLPCIIAQRYNRPRIKRIIHKIETINESSKEMNAPE